MKKRRSSAEMLAEMAELERRLLDQTYARAQAETDPAWKATLSRAYIRQANSLRQTLKLQARLRLEDALARVRVEWPDGRAGGLH